MKRKTSRKITLHKQTIGTLSGVRGGFAATAALAGWSNQAYGCDAYYRDVAPDWSFEPGGCPISPVNGALTGGWDY